PVGSIASGGYNLLGDNSGCSFTAASGDQVGTSGSPINPQLGPLANNGGPTQTHALVGGSPAIDAGNPAGCTDQNNVAVTTDQRGAGFPRVFGPRCDIGA